MDRSEPGQAIVGGRSAVRVDLGQPEPLRRIWTYVGYDEPNYTYTPNGRALLATLGGMSDAPYFIRCHFLLCSGDGTGSLKWGSTNVYTEDSDGNPVYSWEIIDRILDAYLEAGCVPFVEIGFTPEALTSAPSGTPYAGARADGWRYPPRDYGRWLELVAALAAHCLERYGLRQVSRWYWELWNEPDISYWKGTTAAYCRLYDYTVAGLLSVLPQARVGGPGTTSPARPQAGAFLEAFLEHCTHGVNAVTGQRGTRLDFISFHTKGGGYRAEPDAPKRTPSIHTLIRHVVAGLEIAARFPELAGREVILSECDSDGWAAGTVADNRNLFYRNTEYYASYVANAACKLLDLAPQGPHRVDGMLTWAFQFEERGYFEGLRALTTNGVDKPVLNVFRLLGRLGSTRVRLSSDRWRDPMAQEGEDDPEAAPDLSGIAAVDELGGAQVFLCTHHDDWDVERGARVQIRLSGCPPERQYAVERYLVDGRHGNAHTAWVGMGRPQAPTPEQVQAMRDAARLRAEPLGEVACDARGACEVAVDLPAHAVCLLTFRPTR